MLWSLELTGYPIVPLWAVIQGGEAFESASSGGGCSVWSFRFV